MIDIDYSACSISSRTDYSRAASISFRACSGVATIQERHLFGHAYTVGSICHQFGACI